MEARSQLGYAGMLLLVLVAYSGTSAPIQAATPATGEARITVLYDAFGEPSAMEKDWGFAALVEYGGRRILFDTGNDPEILATNARAKNVDLSRLDFVVMSHRHGDHMGGMDFLLHVNPQVKIYAPKENFGIYGFSLPATFYRKDPSLSPEQRYYDGAPPQIMRFGSAWPAADFELIDETTEIAPGIHLLALVSDKPTTLELRELSLVIETPDGLVIVVGCSHPGLDKIAEAAAGIDSKIHLIAGGYHLVVAPDPEIERIAALLHDGYGVDYVAPGHCTGEPAFAAFQRVFEERYLFAGLGTVLVVGPRVQRVGRERHQQAMGTGGSSSYRALAARHSGHAEAQPVGAGPGPADAEAGGPGADSRPVRAVETSLGL